jgi:hypothetical protein
MVVALLLEEGEVQMVPKALMEVVMVEVVELMQQVEVGEQRVLKVVAVEQWVICQLCSCMDRNPHHLSLMKEDVVEARTVPMTC